MNQAPPRKLFLFLAFTAVYLVWGTTYLAAMLALEGLPPFLISGIRCLTAGLLLSAWLLARREPWPARSEWTGLSISGIVMLIGGSGLVIYAEQYIGSGYAAVIVATEPLWFMLLDRSRWQEYFGNLWVVIGLLLGFAGIALYAWVSGNLGGSDPHAVLVGTLILLVSAVLWVVGALYNAKRTSAPGSNVSRSTVQMLMAGVFALLLSGALGEWHRVTLSEVPARAWFGVAYLVVMGSLVAYLAFTWLVTVQPPAVVGTHTYVNPVVAVLAGAWVLHEPVSFHQLLALLVVLVGVLITQISNARRKRAAKTITIRKESGFS